jgi:hypothetical protein
VRSWVPPADDLLRRPLLAGRRRRCNAVAMSERHRAQRGGAAAQAGGARLEALALGRGGADRARHRHRPGSARGARDRGNRRRAPAQIRASSAGMSGPQAASRAATSKAEGAGVP